MRTLLPFALLGSLIMVLSMPAFGESRLGLLRESKMNSANLQSEDAVLRDSVSSNQKISKTKLVQALFTKAQVAEFRKFYQPSMKMAAYGYDIINTKMSDSDTNYRLRVRAGLARNPKNNGAGVQVVLNW